MPPSSGNTLCSLANWANGGQTRPITLDLTGFRGGAKRTIVEAYDPSADSVVFGFDVHSRSPLRIRNNLVDAQLAIDWPMRDVTLSDKDAKAPFLADVPVERLPVYTP